MKRILIILAILIIVFGVIAFLNNSKNSKTVKPVEISKEASSTSTFVNENSELVRVTRVIDGDTVEIEGGKKVRYIGINTPETVDPQKPVQCYGKEATEENKRLVDGTMIRLEKDVSDVDQYGRLLRYVYEGDIFINDVLVRQGFARVSTFPPDIKNQQQFLQAEQEARDNNRGLWSGCPVIDKR